MSTSESFLNFQFENLNYKCFLPGVLISSNFIRIIANYPAHVSSCYFYILNILLLLCSYYLRKIFSCKIDILYLLSQTSQTRRYNKFFFLFNILFLLCFVIIMCSLIFFFTLFLPLNSSYIDAG